MTTPTTPTTITEIGGRAFNYSTTLPRPQFGPCSDQTENIKRETENLRRLIEGGTR